MKYVCVAFLVTCTCVIGMSVEHGARIAEKIGFSPSCVPKVTDYTF